MFLIFFREEIREKRTLKVVAKLGFFQEFFGKKISSGQMTSCMALFDFCSKIKQNSIVLNKNKPFWSKCILFK
jgi:hypothetical protein